MAWACGMDVSPPTSLSQHPCDVGTTHLMDEQTEAGTTGKE